MTIEELITKYRGQQELLQIEESKGELTSRLQVSKMWIEQFLMELEALKPNGEIETIAKISEKGLK